MAIKNLPDMGANNIGNSGAGDWKIAPKKSEAQQRVQEGRREQIADGQDVRHDQAHASKNLDKRAVKARVQAQHSEQARSRRGLARPNNGIGQAADAGKARAGQRTAQSSTTGHTSRSGDAQKSDFVLRTEATPDRMLARTITNQTTSQAATKTQTPQSTQHAQSPANNAGAQPADVKQAAAQHTAPAPSTPAAPAAPRTPQAGIKPDRPVAEGELKQQELVLQDNAGETQADVERQTRSQLKQLTDGQRQPTAEQSAQVAVAAGAHAATANASVSDAKQRTRIEEKTEQRSERADRSRALSQQGASSEAQVSQELDASVDAGIGGDADPYDAHILSGDENWAHTSGVRADRAYRYGVLKEQRTQEQLEELAARGTEFLERVASSEKVQGDSELVEQFLKYRMSSNLETVYGRSV